MSETYRGKAKSYDPKSAGSIKELIRTIYFETYITHGEVPLLMVLPPEVFEASKSWHIKCLLPGTPPVLLKAKDEVSEIGVLLEDKSEVLYTIRPNTESTIAKGSLGAGAKLTLREPSDEDLAKAERLARAIMNRLSREKEDDNEL